MKKRILYTMAMRKWYRFTHVTCRIGPTLSEIPNFDTVTNEELGIVAQPWSEHWFEYGKERSTGRTKIIIPSVRGTGEQHHGTRGKQKEYIEKSVNALRALFFNIDNLKKLKEALCPTKIAPSD